MVKLVYFANPSILF